MNSNMIFSFTWFITMIFHENIIYHLNNPYDFIIDLYDSIVKFFEYEILIENCENLYHFFDKLISIKELRIKFNYVYMRYEYQIISDQIIRKYLKYEEIH